MVSPVTSRSSVSTVSVNITDFVSCCRRPKFLGLTLALLFSLSAGWLVQAEQPRPKFKDVEIRCYARAPEEAIARPIRLEVVVTNRRNASLFNIETVVQTRPLVHFTSARPIQVTGAQESLLDPIEERARIDELYPGRSRTLSISTPYYAKQGFRNDFGYFTVENLIPNLRQSVQVQYSAWIESLQE